jgi:uncharacterized protein YceH (UPF0502 family)
MLRCLVPHSIPPLSALELRVLGTLAEKERLVPDSYPLTLNAIVSGCNQKTSRNPVMETTDSEVRATLDTLKRYNMVIESSGGRVSRYASNLPRVLNVPSQSTALLTVLMLRGPQTAGELRIACERLHGFADISAVEGSLDELGSRPEGALVVQLPRLPGMRENRWAQLLGEPPDLSQPAVHAGTDAGVPAKSAAALSADVRRLMDEVAALKATVGRIAAQVGIPIEPDAKPAEDPRDGTQGTD